MWAVSKVRGNKAQKLSVERVHKRRDVLRMCHSGDVSNLTQFNNSTQP